MTLGQVATARWPRLARALRGGVGEWNRVGEQMIFYAKTLRHTRDAVTSYKLETMRVLAQTAFGVGALAAIGGSAVIATFMVVNTGADFGIIAHTQLGDIGVDALGGFFSAFGTTRLAAPITAIVALSASVGAGATAQLGAMRVNEEIDALEVMGISAIAYCASTRVVAGMVAVIPIFFTALIGGYLATRFVFAGVYGQSSGVYDHYFNSYLDPLDVFWATVQVIAGAIAMMLIHTYYGLTASGGPAGVGEATGRAVRASLVVAISIVVLFSLVLYGYSGHFHLSA